MIISATKKSVTIQAVLWDGENVKEVLDFMDWGNVSHDQKGGLVIHTLEGNMQSDVGDYIIKGVNGEFYPCKPDIFEKTYALDKGNGLMDFGEAIRQAKEGKKIARKEWNGKDMFVVYMEPLWLPPANTQDTVRKVNDRTAKWIGEDAPLDCQPYFAMYNAQKQWIVGWLASQSDMFAEDWYVVGE